MESLEQKLVDSVLVPLQAGDEQSYPFFCVHPLSGNVSPYRRLVRYLSPQQSFYGLQLPDITEEETHYTNLVEMAKDYCQVIQAVQAHGPYALGGYSMGGLVAFEMAVQLQQKGEEVGFLALFDSYPPHTYTTQELDPFNFIRYVMGTGVASTPEEVITSPIYAQFVDPIQKFLPQHLAQLLRLSASYRPGGSYHGPATFFFANEKLPPFMHADLFHDPDVNPILLWKDYIDTDLKVFEIPATHFTLLLEPQVRQVAQHFQKCLDDAM